MENKKFEINNAVVDDIADTLAEYLDKTYGLDGVSRRENGYENFVDYRIRNGAKSLIRFTYPDSFYWLQVDEYDQEGSDHIGELFWMEADHDEFDELEEFGVFKNKDELDVVFTYYLKYDKSSFNYNRAEIENFKDYASIPNRVIDSIILSDDI